MVRRDRHGRSPRGPLAPRGDLPLHGRAGTFVAAVADAASRLGERWGEEWGLLEVGIEDLPPADLLSATGAVPLASLAAPSVDRPARIVLYRRPIEHRAVDEFELRTVVRDCLAERVADLLSRSPEEIDPRYGT